MSNGLYYGSTVPDPKDPMKDHPLNREEYEPDPDEEYDRRRGERAIKETVENVSSKS